MGVERIFPALPAGALNDEARRAAKPKRVYHGPKPVLADAQGWNVKLDDAAVRAIRWAWEREGKPFERIMRVFGMTRHQVWGFCTYRTRAHLDPAPIPPYHPLRPKFDAL